MEVESLEEVLAMWESIKAFDRLYETDPEAAHALAKASRLEGQALYREQLRNDLHAAETSKEIARIQACIANVRKELQNNLHAAEAAGDSEEVAYTSSISRG
jgi:cytosine/adenosine deaminase-related metal-dependent hydrolase